MDSHALFKKLPPLLFSPLAALGAAFYSEVLLTLFVETQRHQEPLSRELALSLILDVLEEQNAFDITAHLDEELPEMLTQEEDSNRRRAGEVLRYLSRCQWLHEEIQRDFTVVYTLPDYAFRLLAVFHEITHDTRPTLQGLVFTIHDLIQAAHHEGNAPLRIAQAHHETLRLLNGLKELQHNIGLHIETVLQQLSPQGVLEHTFGVYLRDVTRQTYHELRTTDHVSRYRPDIHKTLTLLSEEYGTSGRKRDTEPQLQRLLTQIQDIQEHFDALDNLLEAIDGRHRQFFDIAIRSIESKLLAESTTSGHLQAFLEYLLDVQHTGYTTQNGASGVQSESLTRLIDACIHIYELSLVDEKSLMSPRRPREPFVTIEEEHVLLTNEEIEAAREEVLRQMLRSISPEQVRSYAQKLLRDHEERRANDFPSIGPDDLPMLMYLRAYGNGSLGYVVEELPDTERVQTDEIAFRNFLIRRSKAS